METKSKSNVDVAVLCLFFNRPDNFGQVFEQVRKARPSKLFLYQDGPRDGRNDMPGILECRKIAENIDWDCDIHRNYLEKNQGCDPSGYLSRKWAFSYVDKCIILEDDTVPSVSFFQFCRELLDKYENDERITMISGINYQETTDYCPDDYFFTDDIAIWGWATWKRVVDRWDGKYSFLDDDYSMMLMKNYLDFHKERNGFINSMKVHRASGIPYFETILAANHFFSNGLSIVPKRNMINNVGMTANSTHFNGNIKSLPKSYRHIFTMKRFELDFPLKHPKYVINNVQYHKDINKILARNSVLRQRWRQLQTLLLRIRYGDFKSIFRAITKRL